MSRKKKILFLSPYPIDKAPSQRLKYEQYFDAFTDHGYELYTSSFVSPRFWNIIYKKGHLLQKLLFTLLAYIRRFFKLFTLAKYDIVYVHLWVTPIGQPLFEYLVKKLSKRLVYDIDDMVFLGHSSEANKQWQNFKGRTKMIYLMRHSDHVITCTPKLDEFVRQYNQNTTDISSTIDTNERYKARTSFPDKDQIVLGWSGSHSTSKYLYLLSSILKQLAQKYKIKLLVMGDKNFHIEGVDIEAVDWKEAYEIETIQKFDIGIYPLPDEPWVYGKSGLKAIQYMGLSIPTIATAIGANFRIIEDGKNGFLASSEEEWIVKLSHLIESSALRQTLGEAGRKTIEEKYSVEANKQNYIKVFESVL